MSSRRALVTGATGFVGRHLTEHLAANGDVVLELDRSLDGTDITDAEATKRRIGELGPDVLYHLAGWADVGASWKQPADALRVNAIGTQNVLAAAVDAGVQRVLTVSSADVYGIVTPDELPLTEQSPLRPVSPYAASKVASEYLGLQAWLGHRLPVIGVRAFNHLGPGQSDMFVAPALASRIARAELDGNHVLTVGDLSARRDFTDVRDVVRAYRLLMEHGEPGTIYNVCSGTDLAVSDIVDRLVAMSSVDLRIDVDPALLRPIELPVLRGDHGRLTEATGWQPEITMDRTLTDVLNDWRSRLARDAVASGGRPNEP